MIHLIIGGIKSGKTTFALETVNNLSKDKKLNKTYLATSNIFDDEMQDKVDKHKQERNEDWQNIEEPINIVKIIKTNDNDNIILLDCISMWLANLLLKGLDIEKNTNELIHALKSNKSNIIIVSNEVGRSLVSENKLGRKFQNEQGLLNQKISNIANKVDLVIAGLTLNLKSE